MLVSSYAAYPAARALLGDYAIQQNSQDRSQEMLNSAADAFQPTHAAWSALWVDQQQKEDKVTEAVRDRDKADEALDSATRKVYRAVQDSQGEDSPVLKQYLPGGDLSICRRPFSRQLSEMEPYAQAIEKAPDEVIPAATRGVFADAFEKAKTAQKKLDEAKKAAVEARTAREAADPGWDEAYEEYHRTVEFLMKGNRDRITNWIKEWPV